MAEADAVGHVAEDAGEDEGRGEACQFVGRFAEEKDEHNHGHDGAKDNVKVEPAFHQTEGGAGVVDVDEIEEAGDDGDFVVEGDEFQRGPLGQLVEDDERERYEKEEADGGHVGNDRRRGWRR